MRTEEEIREELEAARAEYHAKADSLPAPALRILSARIRAMMDELSCCIAAGAEPCPDCKTPPHGMKVRPGVYEVGCLGCPSVDEIADAEGKVRRVFAAARGETARLAVKAWNSHQRRSKLLPAEAKPEG